MATTGPSRRVKVIPDPVEAPPKEAPIKEPAITPEPEKVPAGA